MVIIPHSKITGSYYYEARNNKGANLYLVDREGTIFLLDDSLKLVPAGKGADGADFTYARASFHPTDETVVFLREGKLCLGDFRGNVLWEKEGNWSALTGSCCGNQIWAAEKKDKKHIQVHLLNMSDGRQIACWELEDELYDSALHFEDIPDSDSVSLEMGAGQDGVIVWILSYSQGDNRLDHRRMFPEFSSYIAPAWRPDGKYGFTLENDERTFALFTGKDFDIKVSQERDEEDYRKEEKMPGYYMVYLENGLVITQNVQNRVYLFEPVEMRRMEELIVQGYEPKAACEVFKNWEEGEGPYGQIETLQRVGDLIIAATGYRDRDNDYLIFREGQLIRDLDL